MQAGLLHVTTAGSAADRLTLSGTGRLLLPAAVTAASGTSNGTAGADADGWGDDELAAEIYGQ